MGEGSALVAEAGDDCCELVVEIATRSDVGHDLFVFCIGVLEALQGELAVAGGGVAGAGGGEVGIGSGNGTGEVRLEGGFRGEECKEVVVAGEAGFEEGFELSGFDLLHGELALEAGGFGEDDLICVCWSVL